MEMEGRRARRGAVNSTSASMGWETGAFRRREGSESTVVGGEMEMFLISHLARKSGRTPRVPMLLMLPRGGGERAGVKSSPLCLLYVLNQRGTGPAAAVAAAVTSRHRGISLARGASGSSRAPLHRSPPRVVSPHVRPTNFFFCQNHRNRVKTAKITLLMDWRRIGR